MKAYIDVQAGGSHVLVVEAESNAERIALASLLPKEWRENGLWYQIEHAAHVTAAWNGHCHEFPTDTLSFRIVGSPVSAAVKEPTTAPQGRDCECCGEVRILASTNPPWCTRCGGARLNCIHCGQGRDHWIGGEPPFLCPHCKKNPLVA